MLETRDKVEWLVHSLRVLQDVDKGCSKVPQFVEIYCVSRYRDSLSAQDCARVYYKGGVVIPVHVIYRLFNSPEHRVHVEGKSVRVFYLTLVRSWEPKRASGV